VFFVLNVDRQLINIVAITATFALPFGLMNTLLSLAVVRTRLATGTFIGDSKQNAVPFPGQASTKSTSSPDSNGTDPMYLAHRIYANYAESVPMALTLAAVVELNGGNRRTLITVLSVLLASRVSHAVGLGMGAQSNLFRSSGYFGSLGALTYLAGWAGYLVRGYWFD